MGDGEEKWASSSCYLQITRCWRHAARGNWSGLVEELARVCRRKIFKVDVAKSDVMKSVSDGLIEEMDIVIHGQVLKEVEVFKSLGSLVTSVGELEAEIQN